MSFVLVAIGGTFMLAGATVKGIEAFGQKKKGRIENARLRRLEKQYKILQDTRQAVIDQSDEIRDQGIDELHESWDQHGYERYGQSYHRVYIWFVPKQLGFL